MEKQNQLITRGETQRALPAIIVGYLEVLSGSRPPEQLARWMTDKFYGEMKYRARRESIARQLTGLQQRPTVKVRSLRISNSAEQTTEVAVVAEISGRVVALAVHAVDSHGRHRVNGIDLVESIS